MNFKSYISAGKELSPCEVGPCHHGMARPQIADGGKGLRYGE